MRQSGVDACPCCAIIKTPENAIIGADEESAFGGMDDDTMNNGFCIHSHVKHIPCRSSILASVKGTRPIIVLISIPNACIKDLSIVWMYSHK